MKILKFSLYCLSILCLSWSLLFFGGPSIIKYAVFAYTGGQLVPAKVSVTPKLDLKISRVDFTLQPTKTANEISGFARAINISWSLFSDSPFLRIGIGPTKINGIGDIDKAVLFTKSLKSFDRSNAQFFAQLDNIRFNTSGSIDTVVIDGNFRPASSQLEGLSVEVEKAIGNDRISGSLDSAKFSLDSVQLKPNIKNQNFVIELDVKNLSSDVPNVKISGLDGDFEWSNGSSNIDFQFSNISVQDTQSSIDKLKLTAEHDGLDFISPIRTEMLGVSLFNKKLKHQKIETNVSFPTKKIIHTIVDGDFSSDEVELNGFLVGSLPKRNFSGKITIYEETSEMVSEMLFDFGRINQQKIHLTTEINSVLEAGQEKQSCSFFVCNVSLKNIDYLLKLNDENIKGQSYCNSEGCAFGDLSHTIVSSNTKEVIKILAETKTLSPLFTAYLYSFFMSGKKLAEGNSVNF